MQPGAEDAVRIEAEIDLDEADYVEAHAQSGAKQARSNRIWLAVVVGLIGAAAALSWPVPIGVWTLFVPLALVAFVLVPRQARSNARITYRETPEAWKRVRLVLDEEHITVESDKLRSYRPWKHVGGWKETDDYVLLLAGSQISDIWPKAAFDDLVLLRATLDRKIGQLRLPRGAAQRKDRGGIKRVVLLVLLVVLLISLYVVWRTST